MQLPQMSTGVPHGKLGKTALQSYALPFLHERHFKQAQQPGLHGKPHHQPRCEAVTTPQQTATYPLKSLWIQHFPEAPTATGCQKSFDWRAPIPAPTALPSSSPIPTSIWTPGKGTHAAHVQIRKQHQRLKPFASGHTGDPPTYSNCPLSLGQEGFPTKQRSPALHGQISKTEGHTVVSHHHCSGYHSKLITYSQFRNLGSAFKITSRSWKVNWRHWSWHRDQ